MSDSQPIRPLVMFGGTFDPVHIGHLRIAWEVAELFDAQVLFVPANVPPHRPQPVASAAQRLAVLRHALIGQDRLAIDTLELERDGPSYSIDTLEALRARIGPVRPLVMLMGTDAINTIDAWKRWDELTDLAHIGILPRPGCELAVTGATQEWLAQRHTTDRERLRAQPSGCIHTVAVTPLYISATHVRTLLAAGRDPRWLLADPVCARPDLLEPYLRNGT